MTSEPPRTVVRPPPPAAGRLSLLARPLVELSRRIERAAAPEAAALAAEAGRALAAFDAAARRDGLPPPAAAAAAGALGAMLDARARGNPALDPRAWGRAWARAAPAAVRDVDPAALRAAAAGAADRELARFVGHCLEAAEARPAAPRRGAPGRRRATLAVLAFALALAAWAGWLEWRFAARLVATMPSAETTSLAMLAAEADRIDAEAAASPLGLARRIPWIDPGAAARARYVAAVDATLPGPLAEAIATALATEGDPAALYDTLRAWAVLSGAAEWRPAHLAGWLADRAGEVPRLAALAPHAAALGGPPPGLAPPDPETLAEARRFAAEGDPADRAFVELRRDPGAAALAAWAPDAAVPGLGDVLVRRSGRPLGEGVPGLYGAAGWAFARDGGAAAAAARASAEAGRLVGDARAAEPEAVLDRLQRATIAAWQGFLADLRVRPFADQPGALMVSGRLGARASPLEGLIREVWRQAGGEDRARSHPDALAVAAAFGPAIQFVEQGRMAEISRLFAGLNVAVAALDADAELGARTLMDVQERAAGVAALAQAPPLVAAIVEDAIAQTAASNEDALRSRVALRWKARAAAACARAIDGRYPFGPGPDAELDEVAAILGPDGLVQRFARDELAGLIDAEASPWRWRPEARLAGLDPASAAFFERAAAVGAALFGAGPAPDAALTLTTLAQRGRAAVSLGGVTAPVHAAAPPAALRWPGPSPAAGFALAFGEDAPSRRAASGPWGLLRFLDALRLRDRDDGRRFLLDVRLDAARAYLELAFDSPANPVAARAAMRGLACPAAL